MPADGPLREITGGVEVEVRVSPGARRSALAGWHAGALKVAVAAPPVEGKANDELCRFLAGVFGVRPGAVELTAGATARSKRVAVRGVTLDAVRHRLEAARVGPIPG
jgi:hypothetical protein